MNLYDSASRYGSAGAVKASIAPPVAPKPKRRSKASKGSPTSRSMALLEERGYLPDIVERRITRTLTKDWRGIADIIAVKPGERPIAVQTTTAANMAARIHKIAESPDLATVLAGGVRVIVHGWRRSGRKATKGLWLVREVEL